MGRCPHRLSCTRRACVSADPDLFFPISASGASRHQEVRAKAVCAHCTALCAHCTALCAQCTVRVECLDFAVASRQVHGVWGGLGEAELAALRRRRLAPDGTPARARIPGTGRVSRGARRRQPAGYDRAAS